MKKRKKKQQKPKTIDNDTSSCPIERASSSWQPVAGTLCEFRNKFLYLVLCLVALKSFFSFFSFLYLRFNDLYHFSQKPSTTTTTCETWEQSELDKSFANCFDLNCAEIVTFLSLITSAFHPDVIGLLFRFNVRSRQSICRIYRGNLRERDREGGR